MDTALAGPVASLVFDNDGTADIAALNVRLARNISERRKKLYQDQWLWCYDIWCPGSRCPTQ